MSDRDHKVDKPSTYLFHESLTKNLYSKEDVKRQTKIVAGVIIAGRLLRRGK